MRDMYRPIQIMGIWKLPQFKAKHYLFHKIKIPFAFYSFNSLLIDSFDLVNNTEFFRNDQNCERLIALENSKRINCWSDGSTHGRSQDFFGGGRNTFWGRPCGVSGGLSPPEPGEFSKIFNKSFLRKLRKCIKIADF